MFKNVLVTGATGFVGSHMVDYLLEGNKADAVHVTKRWHHSRLENIRSQLDKVTVHDCDFTEYKSVLSLISRVRPDAIFHFAAESFVSPSWNHPHLYMRQNYETTVNIFEALRECGCTGTRVHIPGSGEEYGDISPEDLPITEATPLNPVNPYAVSKVAQDLIASCYAASYELLPIRTRAFNHEGPRRDRVFGISSFAYQIACIEKGIRKERVIFTGDLDDKRNFTHVKDMVNAYYLAVKKCKPGELYLVGSQSSNNIATFREMLAMLIEMSGLESDLRIVQLEKYTRPTKVPFLIFESSRFTRETAWQPTLGLREILMDTLNYWRSRNDLEHLDTGDY